MFHLRLQLFLKLRSFCNIFLHTTVAQQQWKINFSLTMTAWKKYVLRRGKDKRENLELQIAFSLFCHQPQY